jgi:radical SAM family uncharacterized protein/radical SAM-linked protein
MEHKNDLLAAVEKPSRYLGTEVHRVLKDPGTVQLRIALAFPDLYEIGTSHFGLQILYHLLNAMPAVAAERVFAPADDMEAQLRRLGRPLFSLESHTALGQFDIVGFSLLYELNYTNVLAMLDLAGIPLRAVDRGTGHPLVIAGGPCTCNPEPMADFFDAMVVGDGEETAVRLAEAWLRWKAAGDPARESLLRRWAEIPGVYIPAFFEPRHDDSGFQALTPRLEGCTRVRRAIVADLNEAAFPQTPVIPFGKPVHDRLRLEISRGCTRGCRFCQAGMLYRPVRERSPERLFDLAAASLAATGYEDLSLLSLSTGDYGCIVPLLERLMGRFASERIAVSLPSLRAGTLTPELMQLIRQVRKTGFTIAPEAGSQRLRDVINKNVTEDEIVRTVQDAFEMGWRLVKLYFMIGLPTETDEDLRETVRLVRRLRTLRGPGGHRGQLNVSFAAFIPKPHTPFQWASQMGLAQARETLGRLRRELALPGVEFKWQNAEMSLLEGVLARGDRRLGAAVEAAFRRGSRFDGWGDRLDLGRWQAAFAEVGIDPDFYTTRPRDPGEPLPWDHIDIRVDKSYLKAEWEKAVAGTATGDCRDGSCNACGSCDFDRVQPRVHHRMTEPQALVPPPAPPAAFKKIQVSYSKIGPARFFGHLELANLFLRALRRAAIPVKYSEGFHPKPKVAFDDPLPTGFESEEERMVVTVAADLAPSRLLDGLNAALPDGLRVHACTESIADAPPVIRFRVRFQDPLPDPERFDMDRVDFGRELELQSSKGKLKKIALKDILHEIGVLSPCELVLKLSREPGKSVRPSTVLEHVFGLAEQAIASARIIRLKSP